MAFLRAGLQGVAPRSYSAAALAAPRVCIASAARRGLPRDAARFPRRERLHHMLGARYCSLTSWALPAVPESIRALVGPEMAQALVPREAVMVDSPQAAQACLPDILASRLLGVDCEGVALGRWGRLCLCQVATTERVYLFDALRDGVLDALRPVLTSSSIMKVMHDSREDASALLSQYSIALAGVFDTQVAHTMLLEAEQARPYQISLNELLKFSLKLENEHQLSLGRMLQEDPNIWFYRPLQEELIGYATQDVMYLPLLHRTLCAALGDPSGGRVLSRSTRYVDYARMNIHLASPSAVERRGLRLQAMLATRTEDNLYFKLNLGAHRQGAVSRPVALARFSKMSFGDIADCWVAGWNASGNVLFLERLEPTNLVPEPHDYTTGKHGRWKRRRPPGVN